MVNGSIWTIRFELMCYGLLAAIGLSGLLRRKWVALLLMVISLGCYQAEIRSWPASWNMIFPYFGNLWELPRFISYYLVGVTFYLFRVVIPNSFGLFFAAIAGSVLVYRLPLQPLLLPILAAYIVFYLAFNPKIPLQKFGLFGDFSYGIYLYAFPVQQLLFRYLTAAHKPLMLTTIAFVISLLLAVVSWHFVEKPFLQIKNRKKIKQPPAVQARWSDTTLAANPSPDPM